jgi:glycosyltransferase involved in cell wall biosynthesis
MPRVTVLMPVYNGDEFLGEAIESVLSQDFTDFEFLIIDDGSSDRSVSIARSYGDGRIIVKAHRENRGIVERLNQGLASARGEYIARMDSDDISHPSRIGMQVRFMDAHPGIAVCGTYYRMQGEHRRRTVRLPCDPQVIRAVLLFRTPLAHPTVMMRTSFLRTHRLRYQSHHVHFEDYGLWKECADRGELTNIPRILLTYRLSPSGVSRNPAYLADRSAALLDFCQSTLDALGMTYDDRTLSAYHALVSPSDPSGGNYEDALSFLRNLVSHNSRISRYPDLILRRTCGEIWYHKCYLGAFRGERTLARYLNGACRFPYLPSPLGMVKLVFRSFLAKRVKSANG